MSPPFCPTHNPASFATMTMPSITPRPARCPEARQSTTRSSSWTNSDRGRAALGRLTGSSRRSNDRAASGGGDSRFSGKAYRRARARGEIAQSWENIGEGAL
jgi:hypothetical protein